MIASFHDIFCYICIQQNWFKCHHFRAKQMKKILIIYADWKHLHSNLTLKKKTVRIQTKYIKNLKTKKKWI